MKPPTPAPAYAFTFHIMAEAAQAKGYALALHGSMQRDLDVVAVPWTEEAAPAEELVDAIAARIGAWLRPTDPTYRNPEPKPHGRRAWQLILQAGLYIDLSVMPRSTP